MQCAVEQRGGGVAVQGAVEDVRIEGRRGEEDADRAVARIDGDDRAAPPRHLLVGVLLKFSVERQHDVPADVANALKRREAGLAQVASAGLVIAAHDHVRRAFHAGESFRGVAEADDVGGGGSVGVGAEGFDRGVGLGEDASVAVADLPADEVGGGVVRARVVAFHEADEIAAREARELPGRLIGEDGAKADQEEPAERTQGPVARPGLDFAAQGEDQDEQQTGRVEAEAERGQNGVGSGRGQKLGEGFQRGHAASLNAWRRAGGTGPGLRASAGGSRAACIRCGRCRTSARSGSSGRPPRRARGCR